MRMITIHVGLSTCLLRTLPTFDATSQPVNPQNYIPQHIRDVGTSVPTRSSIGRSPEAGLPSQREGEECREGYREEDTSTGREEGCWIGSSDSQIEQVSKGS